MKDKSMAEIPSYSNVPEGVFRDIEHYKNVIAGIVNGLARKRSAAASSSATGSYLFDRLVVEFSPKYSSEEIYLDHLNSIIVLRVPKRKNESRHSIFERRIFYLGTMVREVEAMKVIGTTQIYLAISPAGRAKLDRSLSRKRSRT